MPQINDLPAEILQRIFQYHFVYVANTYDKLNILKIPQMQNIRDVCIHWQLQAQAASFMLYKSSQLGDASWCTYYRWHPSFASIMIIKICRLIPGSHVDLAS